MAALVLYVGATILWVYVLKHVPLNVAYPFMGLAFLVVPVAAALFAGEPLAARHLLGGAVIAARWTREAALQAAVLILALRNLRARPARTLFTALAIALGVAMIFAARIASDALTASNQADRSDRLAGADLQRQV